MNEFEEHHIELVWKYLHSKFGFDIKRWKVRFEKFRVEHHIQNRGYEKPLTSDFIYFGNTHINPVLNEILGRLQNTNTFNRLIEFILTGKNQR